MKKTIVIGDIHGGFLALQQVLERTNIQPKDTIVFLGDYVDGWSQSVEVIDFLIVLEKTHTCIFIRGNHDDLLLNYLKTNTYKEEWFLHGGKSTIEAYQKTTQETIAKHIDFLEKLQSYYLDTQNRLFIHAGFTNLKGVEFEHFRAMFFWDRTLWETALALDQNLAIESELYPNRLKIYQEIYIGHTPTTRIGQTIPIKKGSVWNIDTGAAFHGKLTALDIETKEYWQSDVLPKLYPNEKGRNS